MNILELLTGLGISYDVIQIMIFIPIIASIVNISRYLLGLRTTGIYYAIIMSFILFQAGGRTGIFMILIVYVLTYLIHKVLSKVRMHYISRLATEYSLLIILMMAILLFLAYVWPNNELIPIKNINPIALLLSISLSDFFAKIQVKSSVLSSFFVLSETIFTSVIGWYIINNDQIITTLINLPVLILLLLGINLAIGQNTSLRLLDLIRFKQLLNPNK